MARPRTVSDEQIDEAAREAFLEHGPGASAAEVGARLGISAAAVLQRAGSKERLLRRALRPDVEGAIAALARGPDRGRPVARQLEEILVLLAGSLREIVPRLVVLRASALPVAPPREPPPLLLRRLLAGWLRRAGVPGSRVHAEALLGAIEARCFNAHLGGEAFAPGTDRAYVRAIVRGLLPRRRKT